MHRNQLSVDVGTVRALLGSQFPEWAALSVEEFASPGTVNALFRIGDRLAARFPLQPGDVDETRQWLRTEAEAALELLGRTPFCDAGTDCDRRARCGLSAAVVGPDVAARDDRN